MAERAMKWKYIEAVFVPPGVPHPQWREPIGKQLVGEHRSTARFLRVLNAIRLRQWEDRSVHGTYEWRDGCWRLLSESWIAELALHCPEMLPADIEIVDTSGPLDREIS